jgi:The GLUG motif
MKTRTTVILSLTAILTLAAGGAFGAYSGGSGTAGNPYKIATKKDLLTLAANTGDYGNCFILTADINMAEQVFTTAIIAADNSFSFTGTFDGNGHKIANFIINGGTFVGLFGYIDYGGNIKNLGIENCSVNGDPDSQEVGGLVGDNDGSISNCYSTCAVSGGSGSYDTGGLVGYNESDGDISNCNSRGAVSSNPDSQIGGLVGYNDGIISDCNSTGTVSGGSNPGNGDVGGLVGESDTGGSVSNCYSTGAVSGGDDSVWLGGLMGYNSGTISNCYSTGAVSGFNTVGGLAGDNSGTISDCNSTSAVNGFDTVGGLVGDNESDSNISNCYSTGAVRGFDIVGGLVGDNDSSIDNCYSTGAVNGFDTVGGLMGDNESGGSISNCYSTGMVSGYSDVDGIVGYNNGTVSSSYFLITSGPDNGNGAPLTDAQMKQQDNFVDWDFDAVWHICETTNYPKLIWQIAPGDFACPDGVNFVDFAYFAGRWHTTGCNSSNNFCGGADMDFSGTVNMQDLKIFAANWLTGE